MLLVLAILLLLATPLIVLGLQRARARMGAQWLFAAIGALLAWVSLWFLRANLPRQITLLDWSSAFRESPALLADATSWTFAMALATLALTVILTGIGRLEDLETGAWTGSLAVSALGILAVLSGNPLTLALAWTALDIIELTVLLLRTSDTARRQSVVVNFATSLAGTFLLLYADALALQSGAPLSLNAIPSEVSLYLLLAVGLRLGVLPLHLPFLREPDLRRGLGSILRLVSPAASLVLLARLTGAIQSDVLWVVQGFLALAALYATVAWARVSDELVGRPYWILGSAALAFAAALNGSAAAVLAWSMVSLYSGGLLFLSGRPGRWRWVTGSLAVLPVLGLPFTPGVAALQVYAAFDGFDLPFLLAQALLVLGYLRHLLRPLPPQDTPAERWIQAVHPAGLALLLITWCLATGAGLLGAANWWALIAVLLILAALAGLARRGLTPPAALFGWLDSLFSMRWLVRVFGWLAGQAVRLVGGFNRLLEGEGGMLWALLLVTLLLSLLTQLTGGAG